MKTLHASRITCGSKSGSENCLKTCLTTWSWTSYAPAELLSTFLLDLCFPFSVFLLGYALSVWRYVDGYVLFSGVLGDEGFRLHLVSRCDAYEHGKQRRDTLSCTTGVDNFGTIRRADLNELDAIRQNSPLPFCISLCAQISNP